MNDHTSFENRIFKLSTGEKVSSADLEKVIEDTCHYVKYVSVTGDAEGNPIALVFPDQSLLKHPNYKTVPESGCFCPRNLDELGRCLSGCMKIVNNGIDNHHAQINTTAIVNDDIEKDTSHVDMMEKYRSLLHQIHGNKIPDSEEIYMIKFNKTQKFNP